MREYLFMKDSVDYGQTLGFVAILSVNRFTLELQLPAVLLFRGRAVR